jgi:uncharacterized membrane protein YozB (DUF420 family)
MHPNLWFWTGALGLLLLVVVCALLGVRALRQGYVARHRRWMHRAAALTGLFLVAYLVKVLVLGKEDLSTWAHSRLVILWTHEAVVAVMLLSGVTARLLARNPHRRPTWHRLWGRISVSTAVLALLTAGWVLAGMYGS